MEYCPFLSDILESHIDGIDTRCTNIYKSILDENLEEARQMVELLPKKNQIQYAEWISEKKDGIYPFLSSNDTLNETIHRALALPKDNWVTVESLISFRPDIRAEYERWKAAKTPEELAFIRVSFFEQMKLLDEIAQGNVDNVSMICDQLDILVEYVMWNTPETHMERLLRGLPARHQGLVLKALNEKNFRKTQNLFDVFPHSERRKSALAFWKSAMGFDSEEEHLTKVDKESTTSVPEVIPLNEETIINCSIAGECKSTDSSDEENDTQTRSTVSYNKDYANYPDVMNVLVLGETGVGKTTFINSIANYLCYAELRHAAKKNKTKILVETKFEFAHPNETRIPIRCVPTINTHETSTNECFDDGQSCTQKCKAYLFELQTNISQPKKVRIIDTPGIGDTRGITRDKKNLDEILNFVTQKIPGNNLHAICILLKPDNTKLTAAFRFCINELLLRFHISAMKNILFCFTGSRSTHYKPGESVDTLRTHFAKTAQGKLSQGIRLDENTMYVLENDAMRYLCYLMHNTKLEPSRVATFRESWNVSRNATLRLFGNIALLPAHDTKLTESINFSRGIVAALSSKLAEVEDLLNGKKGRHSEIEKIINEKQKDIKDLETQLMIDAEVLKPEETQKPQTVCRDPACIQITRKNPKTNVDEYVYNQICHADCTSIVPLETLQHQSIQTCSAFAKRALPCNQCGHPWQSHIHVNYIMKPATEKVEDETVRKSILKKEKDLRAKKNELHSLGKTIFQILKERDGIEMESEKCLLFLVHNSIIPYNDATEDYINMLIKEKEDTGGSNKDEETIDQLRTLKTQVLEEIRIIKKVAEKYANMPSPDGKEVDSNTIEHLIENLKKLRFCGDIFKNINCEQRTMSQPVLDESINVTAEEEQIPYMRRFLAK